MRTVILLLAAIAIVGCQPLADHREIAPTVRHDANAPTDSPTSGVPPIRGEGAEAEALIGHWQYSGVVYEEDGHLKNSLAQGELDLNADGSCKGRRAFGVISLNTIFAPLDGTYSVQGDTLVLDREPDGPYHWAITHGTINGGDRDYWILTLQNRLMTYTLVRPR